LIVDRYSGGTQDIIRSSETGKIETIRWAQVGRVRVPPCYGYPKILNCISWPGERENKRTDKRRKNTGSVLLEQALPSSSSLLFGLDLSRTRLVGVCVRCSINQMWSRSGRVWAGRVCSMYTYLAALRFLLLRLLFLLVAV
jgi:hypothetical protein